MTQGDEDDALVIGDMRLLSMPEHKMGLAVADDEGVNEVNGKPEAGACETVMIGGDECEDDCSDERAAWCGMIGGIEEGGWQSAAVAEPEIDGSLGSEINKQSIVYSAKLSQFSSLCGLGQFWELASVW